MESLKHSLLRISAVMGPILIVLGLATFTETSFGNLLFCVGALATSWVLSSLVEVVSVIYTDMKSFIEIARSFEMKPSDMLIVEILEKLSELQD